ncbi:MAG TPA: hypothetical protein VFZ78_09225 [Flavisolibacter sp.]
MNGWNNSEYVTALIISNLVVLIILYFSIRQQRVARLLMFLLFMWAGITNWYVATHNPEAYLQYADLAFIAWYRDFINGWFRNNALWFIGLIATGQLAIAISMLLKGWMFRTGALGGMIFLLAITPLGVGAGFPFPLIGALAFYLLYRRPFVDYLWRSEYTFRPKRSKLSAQA